VLASAILGGMLEFGLDIAARRRENPMASVRSHLRTAVRNILYISAVKKSLETIPVIQKLYAPSQRTHPLDRIYGIDTSGVVPVEKLHPDPNLQSLIIAYAGSQPSIVRRGLSVLGDIRDYAFIDLGCGKGRVTTVASEFPFREVIGVELSTALAATARANAATVALRFPDRPQVTIAAANVVNFPLPAGKLVCFNYHAFGPELIAQIVARFEAALASGELPHMFFVYYNPVHSEAFDASPAFARFYVEQIPYDRSEIGFGPDRDDVVAIWQSVHGSAPTPHQGTDRKIILTGPFRAGLAP
jgi:SAM-dependent methyltransferase